MALHPPAAFLSSPKVRRALLLPSVSVLGFDRHGLLTGVSLLPIPPPSQLRSWLQPLPLLLRSRWLVLP